MSPCMKLLSLFALATSAYSAAVLRRDDPATPSGYQLVFGPLNGATSAPGYMGYTGLDSYDVQACADACNTRGADGSGGACQFFNIWEAVTNGVPSGYSCSMYFDVADLSTATNYGQGSLVVSQSRGYRRISILPDGGFEGYTACGDLCYADSDTNWVGTGSGADDATVFHWASYARTGASVGLLGSAEGVDNDVGTLAPAQPLDTVAGSRYEIEFFVNTQFGGSEESSASLEVQWNGATVKTVTGGTAGWTFYQVQVTAAGNDHLSFVGGGASAWVFIDDISVFAL